MLYVHAVNPLVNPLELSHTVYATGIQQTLPCVVLSETPWACKVEGKAEIKNKSG